MKKVIVALLISISALFGEFVNGIAITVNDDPITLYDIQKKEIELNVSKDKAVSELIDETLFNQLIKKYNITADLFDVNNYLEKVAASNGMDLYTFKSVVKQRFNDYEKYEEQTRQQIIRQKLIDKLVRGNIKIATEEDLKIYYENNPSMFNLANNVKAVQYTSKDRNSLMSAMNNPMAAIDGVTKSNVQLNQESMNPQIRYLISQTEVNQFTAIFTMEKEYTTLLLTEKSDEKTLKFEDVKDRIFNILMQDREQKYLKDYFEKMKLSAEINIIR
ncbi:peptidyl-prolyl cis-trans isomerase [Halarcobacter ebronensis]|uniref:Peptidylprolyl isomerase n=1 Tax=Halarcobacter ebronensis TaxID=1462615 RepID=A0A4V1M0V4_9BACT|nr:peptidyl-prolyl cis-trans isomerase [Halarcobacter ebronensis]QKF80662.1 hypothetical protein AEBR_0144 [Halarcobacter ebronensis]RXK08460.1 peptidylprolyl isomerase [Halarcobacter ebronensis]